MSHLDWDTDGKDWPHRAHSRFVEAADVRWHVQVMGRGPAILLLHGTGSSTHSWRKCAPLLAERFTVIAADLPGHAFSSLPARGQFTLPGMAAAVGELMKALNIKPDIVVGHSAGAAIIIRMILDGHAVPKAAVSLNGALMPFPGVAAFAFPVLAKILFLNPFAAPIATRMAMAPEAVDRLIGGTGSNLDEESLAYYTMLFRNRPHVEATLGMMASWDLNTLKYDLRRLKTALTLVSASDDLAVPPRVAEEVKQILPAARHIVLEGQGHLAHEVDPAPVVDIIQNAAA